jgi:hypothetical protein
MMPNLAHLLACINFCELGNIVEEKGLILNKLCSV